MSLRLEDIELIKQLKHRYCRALDTCDTERLASLLTEDFEADFQGGSYRFQIRGRDAFVEAMRQAFHPDLVGSHTAHQPIIEVHDDDTAEGQWTLLDFAMNLALDNQVTTGACLYDDRYVKADGAWRIQRSSYRRLYERVYTEGQPGVTAHLLGELHRQGLAGR
jgi:hypothetical protein